MALPTWKPKDRYPYARHPESRPCSVTIESGDYVYVQDADGIIWVARNAPHQHPKVLGGAQSAAAAGELVIGDQGRVVEVNNLSGTFRLGPETLDAVVQALRDLGLEVPEDSIKRYPKEFL